MSRYLLESQLGEGLGRYSYKDLGSLLRLSSYS